MQKASKYSRLFLEIELKQCISYLKPTLSGKNVHAPIFSDCYGKIAARRRTFSLLHNFFPLMWVRGVQGNRPHIVQPCVTVITGKNPQFIVINYGAMCTSCNRYSVSLVPPLDPLRDIKWVILRYIAKFEFFPTCPFWNLYSNRSFLLVKFELEWMSPV